MSDIAVKYNVADSLVLLQQTCVSLQLRATKPDLNRMSSGTVLLVSVYCTNVEVY